MKKRIAVLLALTLLVQTFSFSTFAIGPGNNTEVQPFYVGLTSSSAELSLLNASSGYLECSGSASLVRSYTAEISMELFRVDDEGGQTSVASWYLSRTSTPSMLKYRYVDDGYTYLLTVDVYVYDSAGNYIEHSAAIDTLYY